MGLSVAEILLLCLSHMFLLYPARKVLKDGESPQLNLPKKSILTKLSKPRSTASIGKRENANVCVDKLSPVTRV